MVVSPRLCGNALVSAYRASYQLRYVAIRYVRFSPRKIERKVGGTHTSIPMHWIYIGIYCARVDQALNFSGVLCSIMRRDQVHLGHVYDRRAPC